MVNVNICISPNKTIAIRTNAILVWLGAQYSTSTHFLLPTSLYHKILYGPLFHHYQQIVIGTMYCSRMESISGIIFIIF